jgi:hypothetical protein
MEKTKKELLEIIEQKNQEIEQLKTYLFLWTISFSYNLSYSPRDRVSIIGI